MDKETEENTKEKESQKEHFNGEFERFKDAECSADGRVYAKEGELYIPELGLVCYGNGPCGKPSQEIDTATPCYHTAYIKTSEGKVYARKDYQGIKKLKEFFDSHGNTLKDAYKAQRKEELGLVSNTSIENAVEVNEPEPTEATSNYEPKEETSSTTLVEPVSAIEGIKSGSLEQKVSNGVKRDGKIVEYPNEGTLFVATDIHGDMDALEKVIAAFEKKYAKNSKIGKKTYLLTLGDDIHCDPDDYEKDEHGIEFDYSYRVLYRFDELRRKYGEDAVINLMGNHELVHIGLNDFRHVGKNEIEQGMPFKRGIRKAAGKYREGGGSEEVEKYVDRLKKRPLVAIAPNGIVFSHTGPTVLDKEGIAQTPVYSNKDAPYLRALTQKRMHPGFVELAEEDYLRYEQHYLEMVARARDKWKAKAFVIGHTPPKPELFINTPQTHTKWGEGYMRVGDNVFIFATGNYGEEERCFLELNLNKPILNVFDISKMSAIRWVD